MSVREAVVRALDAEIKVSGFPSILVPPEPSAGGEYQAVELSVSVQPEVAGSGTDAIGTVQDDAVESPRVDLAVSATLGTATREFGGGVAERESSVTITAFGPSRAYVDAFARKVGGFMQGRAGMVALQGAMDADAAERNTAAGTMHPALQLLAVELVDIDAASTDSYERASAELTVTYVPPPSATD